MKNPTRMVSIIGIVSALAAGCGGGGGGGAGAGGGGGGTPPGGGGTTPPTADVSPGGFFRGMVTGCSNICPVATNMMVSEDGEWVGMDPVYTAGANVGQITMSGQDIDSTRDYYVGNATPFGFRPASPAREDAPADFRKFEGTVVERQNISGTFLHFTATRTKIDVDYDPLYEDGSSLATIAGMYTATDASGFTLTYTIDADGALSGSDTEGCVASGDVSLIDEQYNLYRFELDFSACPANGAQGSHHGVGSLLDTGSGTIDTLLFHALADDGATLVILELGKL